MSGKLTPYAERLLEDPFNSGLRLEYAQALYEEERYEDALKQFDLLIKQGQESAEIYTGAALCHLVMGNNEEALRLYGTARGFDDFEPDEDLETLVEKARATGPGLRVLSGGLDTANIVEFRPTDEEAISFRDIAGMEELKKTLRMQIVEPFLKPGIFAKFKKKAGGGILLYGPPGCGKTMIARAIATECKAYYLSVGISDVLNLWIGESERNLSALFEKARASRPTVLFFDELDALAYSRSKASSEHSRTVVNEFLAQLDGVGSRNEQVLVLAASNMPWDIDPAMKRPGRLARQIFVPPPDEDARSEMFRLKLDGVPYEEGIDFKSLGKVTKQCSGADIDGIIDRAKEYALMDILESGEERELTRQDIVRACEEHTPSTVEWLKTARNLVKYAGADAAYRDVEKYLKKEKLV